MGVSDPREIEVLSHGTFSSGSSVCHPDVSLSIIPLTVAFSVVAGALLTTAVCVIASVMESYAIFALAPPILFSEVCLQLLLFDVLARFKLPQPCRMSSVPKGAPFRPGVYYM